MKFKPKVYDEKFLKNLLDNLHTISSPIAYHEHYLEQLEKRNINEFKINDLLLFYKPLKAIMFKNSYGRCKITYPLNASHNVTVIADIFNLKSLHLVSAIPIKRDTYKYSLNETDLEMKNIYAIDLMNIYDDNGFKYWQTVEFEDGLYIDFDKSGIPVSIEILNASKKFKLKSEILNSSKLKAEVKISDESIKLKIHATVKNAKIGSKIIEAETPNTYNIVSNEYNIKINNIDYTTIE